MRTSKTFILLFGLGLAALGLQACSAAPMIYVHRMKVGKQAPREEGERLKIQKPDSERYGTSQPGFFAVKTTEEWERFWDSSGTKVDAPAIDFKRKMFLVAATESSQAQAIHISSVVETGTTVYVYVAETRMGEGCPLKTGGVPKQDFAVVDHSDKPVHFYLEPAQAKSCGDAPVAKVECRLEGGTVSAPEIMAATGQKVECTVREEVRGVFAAIDRRWSFSEYPAGSASKMTFEEGGKKVHFAVDSFGKYGLKFEITDDAGRKGEGLATVGVMPPRDALYVRVGWANFDASDDPETFPRIAFEATDNVGQTCSRRTQAARLV
jgi:hypothetical protein